ncbi:hypothetical protein M3E18_10220 [Kocuria sp. p3-SID1433]|uniref:hypothetical protein n=1 Tax=Kocuria TaxID=57493 RepID=UPI0021A8EBFC|nr:MULTISPECIES: hypothetical protein [unclassified Kocuria]MCT1602458.1 hypothetical protein [Kocuria sp. p3-SID1428]MCT2180902.1 hypothetical protein [Kocuria sp. p3-SID1433]
MGIPLLLLITVASIWMLLSGARLAVAGLRLTIWALTTKAGWLTLGALGVGWLTLTA